MPSHNRRAWVLLVAALALLLPTGIDAQSSAGSTQGRLRWVRARVAAASPAFLTLQLRSADI